MARNPLKGFEWTREGGRGDAGEGSLRARAEGGLMAFSNWFQIKAQPVLRKFDWMLIRTSALILALSFVLASSVSTFAANMALNYAIGARKGTRQASGRAASKSGPGGLAGAASSGALGAPGAGLALPAEGGAPEETAMSVPYAVSDSGPSGSELRKGILARNLFNSEGKLAPEAEDASGGVKKTKDLDFDAVPCSEEKLPVEVVGTIYVGDPLTSLVSVRDSKVSDNDTYKHGDPLIEHEEYEVHKVFRGGVEFRKGDQKICVSLKGFEKAGATGTQSAGAPSAPGSVRAENVENLDFDSAYVQQEIGPGYANILNSAKLIPEVEAGGKTAGFKIIAISPASLFDKMKLTNGDIITEVNGVSLRDASQGFKLYQALQEEREITVNLTRNGEPMVRKVRVK